MKWGKFQQGKVMITQLVDLSLITADLSKQKALDADPKAIQQIIFIGKTDNQIRVYYIFEQSKETILEFSKGTTKVL